MRQPHNTAPILFLDVDGVISLFGFDAGRPPDGRFQWINGVLHYISPACGLRLCRLAERFELVWATGWEETANEYLPHLLGLPEELPVLRFDGRARFGTAHWKIAAIEEYSGPSRPLAWVDDSLDDSCWAWASERPAPTLLVHTSSHEGMLDRHVEELIAWADRLQPVPAPDA
jgi:HAD domain in Swiss Army Knife RNA repair proteins